MAQIVKLRRSSVSGQKPTNSNLQLGELALNTTDGKVYMAKSGSLGPSVEELVTTNTVNTGSLSITGAITGSVFTGSFIGDGSGLYNLPIQNINTASLATTGSNVFVGNQTITGSINITGTVDGVDISDFSSSVNTRLNSVTASGGISAIYIADEGSIQGTASYFDFIGAGISAAVNNGTASITVTATGGGGSAVQGASQTYAQTTNAVTWSIDHSINSRTPVVEIYDQNYNVIIPTGIYNPGAFQTLVYFDVAQRGYAIISTGGGLTVDGANAILDQSSASSTWTFNHNLGTKYPVFNIFDSNDDIIIPQRINVVDENSAVIYFSSARSGKAVASVGGDVVNSDSSSFSVSSSFATNANFLDGRDSTEFVITSSLTSLSSSIAVINLSQDGRLNSLETFTGSIDTNFVSEVEFGVYTSSNDSKVNSLINATGSYATTGSNIFIGNQVITGSLTVSGSITMTGTTVINQLTYPTPIVGTQFGVEVPILDVNNNFQLEAPRTIYEYVKNDSGGILYKGTPVHSVGTTGFNTLIIAASASLASTMPATFILAQDLDPEEEGLGIAIGSIQGVNTTGLIAGDPVYVGADGGWTQTKPTGSNLIQNLGIVTKVGNNGGGVVLGAGRSNDIPNIQPGHIWIGNSDWRATATTTSSFAKTGSNTFVGNQTIQGSVVVTGDLTAQQYIVSSSILYLTQSFSSGSTVFGDTSNDTHQFTGSVYITGDLEVNSITGSIDFSNITNLPSLVSGSSQIIYSGLTGIPSGIVSGSEQLTGSYDTRYVLSGSITQTTWDNIENKPSGLVSGSEQLTGSYDTRYVLSGSITQTTWDNIANKPNDIVSSSSQISAFGFLQTSSFNTFTSSYNTGSFTGSFTGSLFGTASYAMFALSSPSSPGFTTNMTQSSAAATWSFVHNLNTRNPIVQVYDSSYNQIIPNEIVGVDEMTAEIRFDYSQAGYAVASNGGGLYITGSTSRINQTSNAATWSFTHNLGTKYPSFEVFDSGDNVIIPAGIKATSVNTAEIYFATPTSGIAIANFSGINGSLENSLTSSFSLATNWDTIQDNPITGSLTSATAGTTTTVVSVPTGSYYGAFFDYVVISGSNSRAGTLMSTWNGSSVVFNESTTIDIGNTNQVTMSVDLSGTDVRLRSTNVDQWSVKSLIRLI